MSDLGSILFVSKVNQRHMTSLGWLLTDGYDTAMKWIAAHFFFLSMYIFFHKYNLHLVFSKC
jgi:hypothetical protein